MLDIQLVPLPTPEAFVTKREEYPANSNVVIYETSWISKREGKAKVVVYVGSHRVGRAEPYYGSGTILRKHKYRYGPSGFCFKILKSLSFEEEEERINIENEYIQRYRGFYGKNCYNLRENTGEGFWTAKFKETSQKRFGVDHPFQSEEVKTKIRNSLQEKLGVDSPMQSAEVREKSKQICLQKYGVENISQAQETKDKKRETYEQNGSGEIMVQHQRKTLESKYGKGIINPSQIPEAQQKLHETIMQRYSDPNSKTRQTRSVQQLDLKTGKVIQTFSSGAVAAYTLFPEKMISAKGNICNACRGRVKQYCGFGWRYTAAAIVVEREAIAAVIES